MAAMSVIRSGDPFADRPEDRDPGRRFRGRLAAPVTAWTSESPATGRAAITVASLMIGEGAPPTVLGLIDPLSTFVDAVTSSRRFVVHIVPEARYRLADQLAGRSPMALDRFEDVAVSTSSWGPVLDDLTSRAYCSVLDVNPVGEALLVSGAIDQIDLEDRAPEPLVYLRGYYRVVRPLPDNPPGFR
jgi:3-hydroxy-9,10-secoandrosta-1,3,5(10)-triene-9,17-dione monooxygenase reductase component